MIKYCRKCKEAKSLDQFFKDRTKPDGHGSLCKMCKHAAKQEWRRNNPDAEAPGRRVYAPTARDHARKRAEAARIFRDFENEHNGVTLVVEHPWPVDKKKREDCAFAFTYGEYPSQRTRRGSTKANDGWHRDLALYLTYTTGRVMVVDHIVPRNGVNVCGLDVVANYQVVTRKYNGYKNNKMIRGHGWGEDWSFEECDPPTEVFEDFSVIPDEATMRGIRIWVRENYFPWERKDAL